ncbi:MAG TPA: hypothetical protein VKR42_02370 [Ktedonobacteraceae bacterium]|nr:hypothetical protein [Ktedonobacteraceae bacterium]
MAGHTNIVEVIVFAQQWFRTMLYRLIKRIQLDYHSVVDNLLS